MTSNAFPSDISPAKLLYPDLSNELASTRRMLERVPDGNDDWKPHDKSMTLSKLATHVAELLAFGNRMITTSELDMAEAHRTNKRGLPVLHEDLFPHA